MPSPSCFSRLLALSLLCGFGCSPTPQINTNIEVGSMTCAFYDEDKNWSLDDKTAAEAWTVLQRIKSRRGQQYTWPRSMPFPPAPDTAFYFYSKDKDGSKETETDRFLIWKHSHLVAFSDGALHELDEESTRIVLQQISIVKKRMMDRQNSRREEKG
jgi:hypothetical protein